jgi:chromosome segregation ATPase
MNDNGRMWDEYDKALNKIEALETALAEEKERANRAEENAQVLRNAEREHRVLIAALRARCAELELRLDAYHGNILDIEPPSFVKGGEE